jgi:hypothetical protein
LDLEVFPDPDIYLVGTSGFWQLEGRRVLCPAGHIIQLILKKKEKVKKEQKL